MSNRCELLWSALKKKSNSEKKQDGQGARTPADIERKYNVGQVVSNVESAKKTADDSLKIVSKMSETNEGLELKVIGLGEDLEAAWTALDLKIGRDENDQIVSMINASADVITLNSNRLIINSDYFSLTDDGKVTATSGHIGGWTINDTMIYYSDDGTCAGMSVDTGGLAFWAGSAGIPSGDSADMDFYVTFDGFLRANNAIINGELHSKAGGSMAGFDITESGISSTRDHADYEGNQTIESILLNYEPTPVLRLTYNNIDRGDSHYIEIRSNGIEMESSEEIGTFFKIKSAGVSYYLYLDHATNTVKFTS